MARRQLRGSRACLPVDVVACGSCRRVKGGHACTGSTPAGESWWQGAAERLMLVWRVGVKRRVGNELGDVLGAAGARREGARDGARASVRFFAPRRTPCVRDRA